jgi:hypothetical protein
MERVSSFHSYYCSQKVNECYRDFSPTTDQGLLTMRDQSHANYVVRCRVGAVGLSVRTITPPTTIANQSAVSHGSHTHVVTSFPLAANRNTEATVIAQRTRPSVIVATISLPLASHATTHPTNIDAMTCPIAIPSGYRCRTAKITRSGSRETKCLSRNPPTITAVVETGATRNPAAARCATVFAVCRQYQPRATLAPDFDAS